MKNVFVKTSNYERFKNGLAVVEDRGAMEASFLVVTGQPGYGKSETIDRWAVEVGAAYLRAKTNWSRTDFLKELADTFRLDSSGYGSNIFPRISGYLGRNQTPIVIDEADSCLKNNAEVLESVRDLSDLTEIVVVLVGMEKILTKIKKYKQISSRIADVVTFGPANYDDVLAMCQQKSEVKIEPDLVREIHRQSNGLMRGIMNAIKTVEREAKRNGLETISLKEVAGRVLTREWDSSAPRIVRKEVS